MMRNYEPLNLSYWEEQILIGSLLGDACLSVPSGCRNPRYSESHCLNQREYLIWKVSQLSKLHIKSALYHNAIQVWSRCHPMLWKFYNLFYQYGKKVIDKQILEKVNDLALAIWFYDDGYLRTDKYNYYAGLGCFSESEIKLLSSWFDKSYSLKIHIDRDWHNPSLYNIRFGVYDTNTFLHRIRNTIIPPNMKSKVKSPSNRCRKWTVEEIKFLGNHSKMPLKQLGHKLNRTVSAVQLKRWRIREAES